MGLMGQRGIVAEVKFVHGARLTFEATSVCQRPWLMGLSGKRLHRTLPGAMALSAAALGQQGACEIKRLKLAPRLTPCSLRMSPIKTPAEPMRMRTYI